MATPTRKIKQVPTDVWSIRERLSLACSVMRSGDQNWVSVSRAIKPFGDPNHPPDWFSQKNCALQYSALLEKVETPKRKRGERGEIETPVNLIARNLTFDRIEELKRLVLDEQKRYKKLKREVELIKSGQQDEKLQEVWEDIQLQKKKADEAAALAKQKAAEDALIRSQASAAVKQAGKILSGAAAMKSIKKAPPKQLRLIMKESNHGNMSDQDDSTQDSTLDIPVSGCQGSEDSSSPVVQATITSSTPTSSAPSSSAATAPTATPPVATEGTKTPPPQSPLLSHLLKTKTKLPEMLGQQTAQSKELPSEAATCIEKKPTVSHTPANENKISHVQIKQEPMDVETAVSKDVTTTSSCINESAASVSDIASTAVTKADTPTVTITLPTPVSTATTKPELPSSPSLGAPTLSKLLGNPVASSLPAKLSSNSASSRPITPDVSSPSTDPTSADTPATSQDNTPVAELELKEERVVVEEEAEEVNLTQAPAELSTQPPSTPKTPTPTSEPLLTTPTKEQPKESSAAPCQPLTPTKGSGSSLNTITVDDEVSFKEEPASPASSVVSNVSEGVPKTSRGKRGRPRGSGRRSTRVTRRSVTEKDETGSKQSEIDSSDDESGLISDDGTSINMTPKLNFSLPSESVPNSPASMSQCSDTEDEKAYKVWKKSIMLVWRAAANHKYANVFLHPVTNDIAPGYTSVVFRPMDLHAIKKNVENGVIRTTAEFQRDMMLMFTNAIMYNSSDHNVNRMAGEMYNDVMMHIEQYVNTQMMVQTEPKMLRPSRRSDALSDKEDEAKRRRMSTDHHLMTESPGGKAKKRKTRSDDN